MTETEPLDPPANEIPDTLLDTLPGFSYSNREPPRGHSSVLDCVEVVSAPPFQSARQRRNRRHTVLATLTNGLSSLLYAISKLVEPIGRLLANSPPLVAASKLLLLLGSMAVSVWCYGKAFGEHFAFGIVMLIFIHECGHAFAASLRGIKTGIMVFVPFAGAFVTREGYGQNLTEDAFIGIMGPIVGTASSVVCALLYFTTHNSFWLTLAGVGFFINLFNLLPTPPLDGGWIIPLFSPKLLGAFSILAVVAGFWNKLIWLFLIVSIPRVISGWNANPKREPYYRVALADKWKYGVTYVGLASFLAFSYFTVSRLLDAIPGN